MSVERTPSQLDSGGGAGIFAPTIIVGNELAGDPAVAQPAPFEYVPDPGDGSGISAALLTAGAAGGGWVHIRRGTYTLDPALLPLSVLPGVRVTGDGIATVLVQDTEERRVFILVGESPQVCQMQIRFVEAAAGAVGTAMIDASGAPRARIDNVWVLKAAAGIENVDETLTSIVLLGESGTAREVRARNIDLNVQQADPLACVAVQDGDARVIDCQLQGGNVQIHLRVGAHQTLVRGNSCDGLVDVGIASAQGLLSDGVETLGVGNVFTRSAVGFESNGNDEVYSGNVVTDHSVASVLLSASSENVIVTGNMVRGGTITDNGTDNELDHNF